MAMARYCTHHTAGSLGVTYTYLRDPRPASSSAAYRLTPFLRSPFPVDTTPVLHVFGTAGRVLSMAERLTATRPLLEKVRRKVFRTHGRSTCLGTKYVPAYQLIRL